MTMIIYGENKPIWGRQAHVGERDVYKIGHVQIQGQVKFSHPTGALIGKPTNKPNNCAAKKAVCPIQDDICVE